MDTRTNTKGFTIIEVVLVLAIAALIFLMVFVAFPALSRGQANTARKNDMSTIASAVNTYRTNTNGDLPTTYTQMATYIDKLSQLEVIASGAIPIGATTLAASATTLDTYIIAVKAKCGTGSNANEAVAGTARQAAVLTVLETAAGKYATVCQGV